MTSVVIPVLNGRKALPKTLDALCRQPGEFETIVVDGGSSDRTLEVLSDYRWARVIDASQGRARQPCAERGRSRAGRPRCVRGRSN
jgi:glycosyltransferase involved in cell wall biosynthesis